MGYRKIAKLNPQPDENGIFATGFTRINKLDAEGREVYDPDWDLKPFGPSVGGVWLAELREDSDWPGGVLVQARVDSLSALSKT